MPTVLVVDDSATDRGLAGGLLAKDGDTVVTYASNGREALAVLQMERPDVVVSDLQMPEMNGLELVEAMRDEYPSIPVILMTARGSEEIASEALRKGAAGYVPKVALGQHLRATVQRLLADAVADRLHSRLMHSLVSDECAFQLYNDPELFDSLVAHIQELLRCLPLGNEAERLRVSIGVRHALWIAHAHGNLEIPVTAEADDNQFQEWLTTRGGAEPFVRRGIFLRAIITRSEAVFTLTHDGPGIAIGDLPDNLQEEATDRSWLSRFLLLPSVMDEVAYEENGRTLKLLKKAVSADAGMEFGDGGED